MNIKSNEKTENSAFELVIEVGAAEFQAAIDKVYNRQKNRINIPGFRKGKAPRKMVEKMYGAEIFYDDAISLAYPDAYEAALKETGIKPVAYPQLEVLEATADGFTFKATVTVKPEASIQDYKGLPVAKPEVKVSAADIKGELKPYIDRASRLVSVERKAKKGDTAVIDFEGFKDGEPFQGGKGENYSLELGSGSFVPGFEDQVIGMEIGQEKDIDITFPEDYHADLAGKSVVFHVKLNAVKIKDVPALDDEFAKDVSEFDTLAELKKDVKAKLTQEREEAGKRAFEDIVMGKAAELMEADIPDAMVEEQARRYMENLRRQVQAQGIPFDQYMKMTNMDEEKLLEEARTPALGQVRMDLTIAAIVEAENLEATDEEVEAELAKMAGQYGMDVENMKKYMDAEVIREQVLRGKAVAVVADSAVAVKPAEEEKPKKKSKKDEEAPAGESAE